MPTFDYSNFPNVSPVIIHSEGIINLLSNLREHKTEGPYEIPTILLKRLSIIKISCSNTIIPSLSSLPTEWKTANVVSVLKYPWKL